MHYNYYIARFLCLYRTKTLVNGHPTRSIGPIGTNGTLSETTSAPKKTTNGIGTTNSSSLVSATETKNKTNARIDKESDQNAKSNNLPVTNGGGEGNIIPPRRSGYNCRDREKFHKCSICKKMFGQKASLLMHEKEHVLESAKPHACNYCDKLYSTVASYERHLKTRHPKCILCRNILTMKQIENQPEEEIGINQVNLCTKCRKKENDAPIVKRRHSQTSVTELNGKNPTTTNGFEHGQTSEVFSGDNGISTVNGNGEHFANNGNVLPDGTNQLGDGDETILFCGNIRRQTCFSHIFYSLLAHVVFLLQITVEQCLIVRKISFHITTNMENTSLNAATAYCRSIIRTRFADTSAVTTRSVHGTVSSVQLNLDLKRNANSMSVFTLNSKNIRHLHCCDLI